MCNFMNKLRTNEFNCSINTNYHSLNIKLNCRLNITLHNNIQKLDLRKISMNIQYIPEDNYITNNQEFYLLKHMNCYHYLCNIMKNKISNKCNLCNNYIHFNMVYIFELLNYKNMLNCIINILYYYNKRLNFMDMIYKL